MKMLRAGTRVSMSLPLAILSIMMGCADPHGDDPHTTDDLASFSDDATEAAAQEFVPPSNSGELSGDHIKIESIRMTGRGCQAGTWSSEKVPESNAFTLTFNKYIIEAQPTATPTSYQLPCSISLTLRTPKNLSYSITSFQYFGYANLSNGMKATLLADYAFTGYGVANSPKEFRHNFPVPYDTTYAVNDDFVARGIAPSWAPCDITSNLQIRTRLILENSSDRPGVLAMDNLDARSQAALKINVQTGPCPTR